MSQQENKKLYCNMCNAQTDHKPISPDMGLDMPDIIVTEWWECIGCGYPRWEEESVRYALKKQGYQ